MSNDKYNIVLPYPSKVLKNPFEKDPRFLSTPENLANRAYMEGANGYRAYLLRRGSWLGPLSDYFKQDTHNRDRLKRLIVQYLVEKRGVNLLDATLLTVSDIKRHVPLRTFARFKGVGSTTVFYLDEIYQKYT
jgi:hypothetical protein